MQRGFIQIPVLIAIIVTALIGGGGYVAYEVTNSSQEDVIPQAQTASVVEATESEAQATTTSEAENAVQGDGDEPEVGQSQSKTDQSGGSMSRDFVESVTDEVAVEVEAQVKTEKQKTNIVTLPNGAVVELDENGGIARWISGEPEENYNKQPNSGPAHEPQDETVASVQISSVDITATLTTADIEWQTNKPTESKIFLSGGGLSSKVYNSESGLSTRHLVSIGNLKAGTIYSYEIEAIRNSNAYKKSGSFSTKTPPPPTFSLTLEAESDTDGQIRYPIINQANGTFSLEALVIRIDTSEVWKSFHNNVTSRIGKFTYCNGVGDMWKKTYGENFPFPCPVTLKPDTENENGGNPVTDWPMYIVFSKKDWAGGADNAISFHKDIPMIKGTDIYYWQTKDAVTGKVFSSQ